mgnify:CR=1 FL=1
MRATHIVRLGHKKSPPDFRRAFSVALFSRLSVLELGGEELAVQAGPAPPFSKGRSGGIVNNGCVQRISPAATEKPSENPEGFFCRIVLAVVSP